ncbi:MAG TPA: glycosyltransferase family 39 protein [Chloroflexota bacterium]|jgi:4-amino-4-deoxy-L-arabinose transferase-like glycosyltransferase|nr:glycosyltransferase family 39 protein [Chloroflexota bacterium]
MTLDRAFANQRLNQIVALAAILVLAGVLRFVSLAQRGLIYWDEAKFALEGVRLHSYIVSWFGGHASLLAGKTIGTAKPTHDLLIALAYLIFGIHTYTPLFMDAFCSVLEVGVVFLLGRRLFGPWVGLIAALFLAVSEYDVIYARSALSESDADLLFLIGVVLWAFDWERIGIAPKLKGRPTRLLVLGGLVGGAAFTANYRLGVYILVLLLFDLAWTIKEFGRSAIVRRAAVWLPALIAFPLAWQVIDIVARGFGHPLFRSEVNILVKSGNTVIFKNVQQNGLESYFIQTLFQLHGSGHSGFHFGPIIYLKWFVLREGWLVAALVLAGLFFALRSRQFQWLIPASLVVVPYAIYVIAPYVVPRNLDAALPFALLLAAAAVVTLAENIPVDVTRRLAMVGAACVVGAYGAWLAWPLTGERSGFAYVAAYVQAHEAKALASNEVMVWYIPGPDNATACVTPGMASNKRQLAVDIAAGYRYAEIETIDNSPLDKFIVASARRVARYPTYGSISIGENPVKSENGDPPNPKPLEYVSLYDLSGLRLPPAGGAKMSHCNRDVPI